MTNTYILTSLVPVLGTVAVFRSHLYAYFLDEMERLNQSKHFPSVLLTLFRCPMCVGLHAAWIWQLFTDYSNFGNLATAGYALACALASLVLYQLIECLGTLSTFLELKVNEQAALLPKAVDTNTQKEVDDA